MGAHSIRRRSRGARHAAVALGVSLQLVTLLSFARVDSALAENGRAAAHDALLERIQQDQRQGALVEGVAAADRALALALELQDPLRIAATRSLRAQLLVALGSTVEARAEFARALAESASSPALRDATLLNLANLDTQSNRMDEALSAYKAVFASASARGETELAARAGANALRADVELDASTLDLDHVQELVAIVDRIANPSARSQRAAQASLLIHLARTVELGQEGGAEPHAALVLKANELLRRALELAEDPNAHRIRAEALGRLGALYASEGHIGEALDLTMRALAQARRSAFGLPLYRWQVQAAELFAQESQIDEAIEHYAGAIELLGPLRSQISAGRGNAIRGLSFEYEIARTYRRQVDLLLRRAAMNQNPDAGHDDIRQARAVLEDFKVAELRDYFEDDCVDQARDRQTKIEGAAADAAVIYPIVLDDRLEIIVSKGDRIESRRVEVSRVDFEAEVELFRELLGKRTTRQYLRPAMRLHDWLIAPLSELLVELEPTTLVFVPDGVLRTVPMAALHDGQSHLVERFALAVTPSLELTDPRPLDRNDMSALYAGLTVAVQGFAPLPQVAEELQNAQGLIPGELLMNDGFSSERLVDRLSEKSFDLVHIGSHAEFGSRERGGFLLTHDGRLSLDELRDAVGLLRFRSKPLELLVLSACQTAVGDDRAALGLSGAAVQAGARSVLGSLWTVQDDSTARLITSFYEALKQPSVSRAEALRRAQRELMQDSQFGHPLYWAPFLLINSWL